VRRTIVTVLFSQRLVFPFMWLAYVTRDAVWLWKLTKSHLKMHIRYLRNETAAFHEPMTAAGGRQLWKPRALRCRKSPYGFDEVTLQI
jgi:hypothetical protein